MIKYSLIIPVYNTEQYLKKCLDSVVTQTFNNFEAIIVNDGSTDSSGEIIDEFTNKYQFIHKIDKENTGVSDSRNIGVQHSVRRVHYIYRQ